MTSGIRLSGYCLFCFWRMHFTVFFPLVPLFDWHLSFCYLPTLLNLSRCFFHIFLMLFIYLFSWGFQDVLCLRLLKKFDHNDFESKLTASTYDGFDTDNVVKHGKRGQITDQFLELPMEYRIYDMIDAEGSKGITIFEVILWFFTNFVGVTIFS